jgi:hypothetical protein
MMDYTYNEGRKCKHCGVPIADQVHATREYCPRKVLSDGSIKNCKDDFNSALHKKEVAVYRNLIRHQKLMHKKIQTLFKTKGEKVSTEDINRYGINLSKPIQFELLKNKLFLFYFNEYAIEQLGDNQFKIFSHGQLF